MKVVGLQWSTPSSTIEPRYSGNWVEVTSLITQRILQKHSSYSMRQCVSGCRQDWLRSAKLVPSTIELKRWCCCTPKFPRLPWDDHGFSIESHHCRMLTGYLSLRKCLWKNQRNSLGWLMKKPTLETHVLSTNRSGVLEIFPSFYSGKIVVNPVIAPVTGQKVNILNHGPSWSILVKNGAG